MCSAAAVAVHRHEACSKPALLVCSMTTETQLYRLGSNLRLPLQQPVLLHGFTWGRHSVCLLCSMQRCCYKATPASPWEAGGDKEAAQGWVLTTNRLMAVTVLKSAVACARVAYSSPGAMSVLDRASHMTACCRVPACASSRAPSV